MIEWFREREASSSHQSPDLNSLENLWDVLEKTLHGGLTVQSSIQDHDENLMQVWMEINVVTFTVMEKALGGLNNASVNVIEAKGDSVKDCVENRQQWLTYYNTSILKVCVSGM